MSELSFEEFTFVIWQWKIELGPLKDDLFNKYHLLQKELEIQMSS